MGEVILINNLKNNKKKHNLNSRLITMSAAKNPKQNLKNLLASSFWGCFAKHKFF